MARAVWSGSISFGLVNVPVKAFSALRDHDVHFHQIDKKSGARVRTKKVSDKSGRELKADDIEMGFEVNRGTYVTFEKDACQAQARRQRALRPPPPMVEQPSRSLRHRAPLTGFNVSHQHRDHVAVRQHEPAWER